MSSFFIDNHSRYFSNCLSFFGNTMVVKNSTFVNNSAIIDIDIIALFLSGLTGLPDIASLNPEVGGVLYFAGVSLLLNQSFFRGGTGFKGGAVYLTAYELDVQQSVLITECYFKINHGNVGGAINYSINLKVLDAIILYCVFIGNIGKSMFLYY